MSSLVSGVSVLAVVYNTIMHRFAIIDFQGFRGNDGEFVIKELGVGGMLENREKWLVDVKKVFVFYKHTTPLKGSYFHRHTSLEMYWIKCEPKMNGVLAIFMVCAGRKRVFHMIVWSTS